MRKELIVASIIGIGFGLVIAFGVYRINSSLKPNGNKTLSTPNPKTVISEFKITLDKPQNNDVLTEDSIAVTGITKPLTWISVSGEDEDYVVQSDDKGLFSQDVNLIPGVNQIKLTAFDALGAQSIEKVLVVYSSSFQERGSALASPSAGIGSSSDSGIKTGDIKTGDIRAKVEEKVKEALNRPKAYLGTVTDISDSTIQIKTAESQIQQISVKDDGIAVVKTGTINKAVKLTDVAIGDFIVAMGYINSNTVLNAQRILITDPVTEPKVNATFGKLIDIDKKITTSKSVKAKLKTIKDDDLIIFVIDGSGTDLVVRSIFVIQKS